MKRSTPLMQHPKPKPWKHSLLAVTALLIGIVPVLSACTGSADEKGTPSGGTSGEAKPQTFTMLYSDNPAYPFNKDWRVLKEMTARSGVNLDIQAVPESDYQSKVRIVLSSDKIPDMVTTVRQATIMEFAPNGTLLPISDYMDKLPNLKKKIEEYKIQEELDNWKPKDGKLYVLPFMNEAALYNRAPLIRSDLLKKYGLEAPKTADELYNVLKKLKEMNPGSYPLANTNAESLLSIFGAAWGIDSSNKGFSYNASTRKFEYDYTSDNYKKYVTFLNRLVKEGLADPEIFTSSLDQWKQKLASGKSLFSFYWISELPQINADGKKNVSPDFELTALPPIAGPGGTKAYSSNRIYHGTVIPASAAKKPYFDALMKYADWLYSDEANTLMTWGFKGDTYEEADGKKDFTDKVKNAPSINKALWELGAANNNYTLLYPYQWFLKVLNTKEVGVFTDEAIKNGWFPPVTKIPKLTPEKKEEENLAITGVNDYFAKMQEQFVYGKVSIDAEWDNYVKEMNSKGVTKLLGIYNDSLK
ncbi:extracellular solute-binding protein [Paenibacillus sp. NPDC056579]|uniref:extracellular solute-binding protein n=1 Tax=Paenibacillus sp. NPDC056579 TaxID=3345871 RepID=UPI00367BBC54